MIILVFCSLIHSNNIHYHFYGKSVPNKQANNSHLSDPIKENSKDDSDSVEEKTPEKIDDFKKEV